MECYKNIINEYEETEIYNHLEFFKSTDNSNNFIFNKIDKTYTDIGSLYLKNILLQPNFDIDILEKKQIFIKNLQNNLSFEKIHNFLKEIKILEPNLKYIINEKYKTKEMQKLLDNIYFKKNFLKFINKKTLLIHLFTLYSNYISPIFDICSPLTTIISAFYMVKRYGFNLDTTMIKMFIKIIYNTLSNKQLFFVVLSILVWLSMYIYSTYKSIKNSLNNIKIINYIRNIIISISKIVYYTEEISIYLNYKLKKNDFIKHYSVYENFKIISLGNILTDFLYIAENKHKLYNHIKFLGFIDSQISIVLLHKSLRLSYSNFIKSDKPLIKAHNIFHPLVNNNIPNSITIDKYNNILITGNNAAGKSIFMKSLIISILLSQTLTISFTENIQFTPFNLINTHINIPDCSGKESLFQAELNRLINVYKQIKNNKNKFSLLVVDELFSSTNPKEAISASFSICKNLSNFKNSINIVTTHYDYLTKLNKYNWINYYFQGSVIDNNISYDYKIKEGKCNSHIALKILEKKINDNKIVADAKKIFKKLKI
jgi:DNA mismatch repair ATPase MutS